MGKFEGKWETVAEFAEWKVELVSWATEFGIYREIRADDQGKDPSGEIDTIDEKLVWSQRQGDDNDVIVSGREIGDWNSGGIEGWFISSKPWTGEKKFIFDALKEIDCPTCKNGEQAEPEDCDDCESDGTVWLRIQDLNLAKLDF